jgi:hypothetical protein
MREKERKFMKKTLLHFELAALTVALLVLGSFTAQGASTLGFNYWPGGWGGPNQYCDSQVLSNANWTAANKAIIQRDLDHMASLGAGVIRFVLWPGSDGWILSSNSPHGPGGAQFTSIFAEQTTNIVELIGFCKARNMKVIICFANSYMGKPCDWNQTCDFFWQTFYLPPAGGDDILAFTHFLWDTQYWIDGFVSSIEGSANASTVLYYDMFSEYDALLPHMDWYDTFVFDWSTIPNGKKGQSVLSISDAEALRVAMGTTRLQNLTFTDFHCYPTTTNTNDINAQIDQFYDTMRAKFPLSTTIMGEFGHITQFTTQEADQQTIVTTVANRAKTRNILYHAHWLLFDKEINPNNYYGLGYTPHYMKDAMGGLSSLENLIYNSDLEIPATGAVPTNWGFGSSPTGNTTFTAGGPSQANACTNSWYGRITRTVASGSVWMNVPAFAIGSPTNKKLYVNFFLRSSITNISPTIHEYDGNWDSLGMQTGTSYTPLTWTWYNYRTSVGAQSFTLNNATRNIIVTINGTSISNPAYLDVDTVSAFVR